jgi:hypothetical protein
MYVSRLRKIVRDSVERLLICAPAVRTRIASCALVIAAVSSASLVTLLSDNQAGAMGGGTPFAPTPSNIESWRPAPSIHAMARHKPGRRARRREDLYAGPPVCVRLCDGSFFPSITAAGGDAACQAQCPDAPTALYLEILGPDSLEDAVSVSGALYSDLPVAGRYRTVRDNTCACHHDAAGYMAMLLHDRTLQKGDAVMTPTGIVVYEGGTAGAPRPEDFVALAQDSRLSADVRNSLSKMRSTSTEPWQPVQHPPSTHAVRKGTIWVDSPSRSSQ